MEVLQKLETLSELIELRELYKTDWPKHHIGYYLLENFIKWFERTSEKQLKHVKIFTLNRAESRESGLFLLLDRYQLFINAIRVNEDEIKRAVKSLDWNRGYKITSLHDGLYDLMVEILNELKISYRFVKLNVYRLAREKALQFKEKRPPVNFLIRPLRITDAEIINDIWYSRQPGSLEFFKRIIEYNISVGVYKKSENDDQLVAWCTRCQCGFLGTLHVLEPYRRLGLAKLIISLFSRQVAETGQDVFLVVNEQNKASNELFTKMNFENVGNVYHMPAYRVSIGEAWTQD